MGTTVSGRRLLSVTAAGVLALVLTWPAHAQPGLPPRPTPVPATPAGSRHNGALIQLAVVFPQSWPWANIRWQTLWTAVEWQDGEGDWHLVEGWQDRLNEIQATATVTGLKTWWLTGDLCGRGPFRWVISLDRNGPVLAVSDPFMLPGRPGETLSVTVHINEAP